MHVLHMQQPLLILIQKYSIVKMNFDAIAKCNSFVKKFQSFYNKKYMAKGYRRTDLYIECIHGGRGTSGTYRITI